MTDQRAAELRQMLAEATPGPWRYCGETKGHPCQCHSVWCDDHPIADVTSGKWGDPYSNLRRVEGTGDIEGKFETFIDMIEYGYVAPEVAEANTVLIAAAVNELPGLLDEIDRLKNNSQHFIKAVAEHDLKQSETVGVLAAAHAHERQRAEAAEADRALLIAALERMTQIANSLCRGACDGALPSKQTADEYACEIDALSREALAKVKHG